jgi:epoxyqueuosine reductase
MQSNQWNPELRHWLDQSARAVGFDVVGVAEVHGLDDPAAAQNSARYAAWIDAGHAGEMEYLKRRDQQGILVRGNLNIAVPWARTVIACAVNYNFATASNHDDDSLPRSATPLSIDPAPAGSGWIARYAWTGRALEDGICAPTDYHDELLTRLREIESGLILRATCTTRCYVDTGPLVERSLAAEAGIGWIGKNTCLLNQQLGSWLLLGVIITSLSMEKARETMSNAHSASTSSKPLETHFNTTVNTVIEEDRHKPIVSIYAPDRCGSCTRCIDACPTGALLGSKSQDAPRTMDASRCIAYLTIEKKGAIDPGLRAAMGRHVFGCDICQDVCPWNCKAFLADKELTAVPFEQPETPGAPFLPRSMRNGPELNQPYLQPRPELINPSLDWLAAMDTPQFKRLFKGSPLERTGRKRLLRNVAIAMGNSGEVRFLPQLEAWAAGDDPVLADAAQWARARLLA